MTAELPPAYRQTVDHLLFDPRPGPRHTLRVEDFPRRPSDLSPKQKESPVPYDDERDPLPASREVFDPDLGSDGGGRYADSLPAYTVAVDDPAEHALSWSREEPTPIGRTHSELDADALVPCYACGTGVHPSRIIG